MVSPFLQPVAFGWLTSSCRLAHDELGRERRGHDDPGLEMFDQGGCEDPSGERPVLADARQRWAGATRNVRVVVPDDRDILGNLEPSPAEVCEGRRCEEVAVRE